MRTGVAAAILLGVIACGPVPQATLGSGFRLYEAAARPGAPIVALIDTRTHGVSTRLPLGTPSPDWKHYYTVSAGSLLDLDPETGASLARIPLPGDYSLPPATSSGMPGGLSQNGAWLVLQRLDASSSHLLVFDTTFNSAPRTIDLAGRFMFDAISNDGERVFLIEYITKGDYHVRVYGMSGGGLDPNFVFDKNEGGGAMNGLKLSGVASGDGQWLFSVYARAHQGAFIHALNLSGAFAFCLDLPGAGYLDGDKTSLDWSLALSPDGSRLYAANPALAVVTEINATAPSTLRTVHVGSPSPVWPAGAVVSADSRTLAIAGSTGVVWLDAATLMPSGRALDRWTVRGLALSPDGKMLYAVNDTGGVAELSMASRSLTSTFDPSVADPIALMRVEAIPA